MQANEIILKMQYSRDRSKGVGQDLTAILHTRLAPIVYRPRNGFQSL